MKLDALLNRIRSGQAAENRTAATLLAIPRRSSAPTRRCSYSSLAGIELCSALCRLVALLRHVIMSA